VPVRALFLGIVLLAIGPAMVSPAFAQDDGDEPRLPRQVLYLPLGLDPDPATGMRPVGITFRELELPDARRAQWIRLGWWVRLTGSSAARVSVDYVGLESTDRFLYGGGRADVQWAQRLGGLLVAPSALDLAVTIPTGDASLHPLSAKAPALRARLRVSPLAVGGVRWWLGGFVRMVSPPAEDVREDPLSAFPSGRGLEVAARGRWGAFVVTASARHPLDGLPESTSFFLEADWSWSEALALRVGGLVDVGPRRERSLDHGWTLGLVWRPAPRPTGDDRDDPASPSG
jgi:hypothetical protein